MGEPPATSAVATTTIPEPLEDAVAAIEAREQAETEAEPVETAAASAESRLEVLELAWAEQQVVPAVRDQAMQMILGIVERHSESWPWIVSALDRGGVMFFEALPEPVGARNCVGAGQAALRYSLMSPPQRVVRTIRSCCPVAFGGCVGAGGR